jgi:hypothetical protein
MLPRIVIDFFLNKQKDALITQIPKLTGSNPAETVGFFREKNSSARLPSEEK